MEIEKVIKMVREFTGKFISDKEASQIIALSNSEESAGFPPNQVPDWVLGATYKKLEAEKAQLEKRVKELEEQLKDTDRAIYDLACYDPELFDSADLIKTVQSVIFQWQKIYKSDQIPTGE